MKAVLCTLFAASAALAQTAPRPAFDVATIRPSAPFPDGQGGAAMHTDGAQVRGSYMTLKDYISIAYRVKLYQVSGPGWMATQRFDIAATLPSGVAPGQMPEMLQTLLEDRFQLKIHREKKDLPVYALAADKSALKLKESASDPDTDNLPATAPSSVTGSGSKDGVAVNYGRGSSYSFANNRFEAKKLTMTLFAVNLERFVDRPIVDATELKARYDFTIEVSPEDYQAMLIRSGINAGVILPPQVMQLADGATYSSLMDAVKKLGLQLESRKAPLDMLIVDETRKTPIEN